jgi:hypothetical protein
MVCGAGLIARISTRSSFNRLSFRRSMSFIFSLTFKGLRKLQPLIIQRLQNRKVLMLRLFRAQEGMHELCQGQERRQSLAAQQLGREKLFNGL